MVDKLGRVKRNITASIKHDNRSFNLPKRLTAEDLDPLLAHIAERIITGRQRLGMTQEQLAEKAGCAPLTVTHVEGARRNVTLKSLSLLSGALGIDICELFPRPGPSSGQFLTGVIAKSISIELARIASAMTEIQAIVSNSLEGKLPEHDPP